MELFAMESSKNAENATLYDNISYVAAKRYE